MNGGTFSGIDRYIKETSVPPGNVKELAGNFCFLMLFGRISAELSLTQDRYGATVKRIFWSTELAEFAKTSYSEGSTVNEKASVNPMTTADIFNWCVLAVILTCIITFACVLHEQYTNRKGRKRQAGTVPTLPLASVSNQTSAHSAPKKLIVRGYDSPELLREDLWLLRLDHAHGNVALLNIFVPPFETTVECSRPREPRITAMLAQYAGARCDN